MPNNIIMADANGRNEPKLIAHAELTEASRRIDAEIPEEYNSCDIYKAVVKWNGTGNTYPCPNVDFATSAGYIGERSANRDYTDEFYVVKTSNKALYMIPVKGSSTFSNETASISAIGMNQYYGSSTLKIGTTIDIYVIVP